MRTLPLAALTLLLACSPSCSRSEGVTQTLLPPPSRDGWLSETPFPGYNLISPLKSTDVFLVNLEGEVVHRWETKVEPGNSVYLTDRGTLYRCERIEDNKPFRGGGIGGAIQEIDADGTILWDYRFADDTRHAHHDIEIMPNGNILILAWVMHTREEALANGRDPELLRGEMFWPDSIFEIKPLPNNDAEIVWEWHSWDHLIQDFDKDANFFGVVSEHPERIDINGDRDPELLSEEEQDAEFEHLQALGYAGGAKEESDGKPPVKRPDRPPPQNGDEKRDDRDRRKTRDADWMHTNGIDYNAELDQIVISVRRFDEAWVIDHSTTTTEAASSEGGRYGRGGDLLYRWGNPSAYGMGSAENRVLVVQHDVQWIEGGRLGAGGFLAFNNGRGRLGGDYSTIEEWWPPINEAGEYVIEAGTPFAPAQSSWTYMADTPSDFYSSFISGVQRLPNGNTLICSGEKGNVFEINSAGKTVWQWDCDLVPNEKPEESKEKKRGIRKNALFRVTRIAPDHAGLEALRAKGLEIPRSVAMPIAH